MNFTSADFLNSIPWHITALIAIGVASFFAIGCFLLFRKLINPNVLRKNQEIASYALNTIALLYCVIVGFVVIRVQERNSTVRDHTVKEANLLLNLYYASCDVFSHEISCRIREEIRLYATDVINREWPKMANCEDLTMEYPKSVHNLWATYDKINPQGRGQAARYSESLSRLNDLSRARFGRLSNVDRSEGAFMWTVLIYGGILVVISSYLFVSTSVLEHMLHLFFISSFIVLVLLLIYSLDTPFAGPTAISPKPFEHVLELIDEKHRCSHP
ncbi:MAG: DUF4239 domain-containing protein [Verrucomicrobia bacterium]|nr:DUF4239 domain-containing protein [Verrucomicrobiota bacterium]MBS0636361.1 DUF4239 domain-containing protein [Verrucomicrobiota bacterium]